MDDTKLKIDIALCACKDSMILAVFATVKDNDCTSDDTSELHTYNKR